MDVNSLTKEFSFQLTDPIRRNVYQFRTESSEETNLWLHHLNQAVNVNNINKRSSKNLMSFDWTNYSNLFLLCPQALIENEIKCHVIKLSHVLVCLSKTFSQWLKKSSKTSHLMFHSKKIIYDEFAKDFDFCAKNQHFIEVKSDFIVRFFLCVFRTLWDFYALFY